MLVLHEPVRRSTLSVLRLPFTLIKTCVALLVTLPNLPSLAHENASLRAELLQRQLESAQLREALRQAEQTSRLLEAVSSPTGVVAEIIERSTIPTQQTMLVDKGQQHGLTLDSAIVAASGVVGRVMEVHGKTSLIMLLTDPESRVAGIVERSRETGLLIGRGLGQCEFIYLDVHADIEVGDRVVTAGLGGVYPKGLLLGVVSRVMRDEASGTASALVQPATRLSQLEEVLCLPPASTARDH